MTCSDCIALIPAFIDGTLSTTQRAAVVSHVQTCSACRLAVHQAYNARGYISCRDVVELVSAYLDGTLSPVEHGHFEQHLAVCPPCRMYVEQMRQTIAMIGTLTEESLSEDTKLSLLDAFRAWTSPEPDQA